MGDNDAGSPPESAVDKSDDLVRLTQAGSAFQQSLTRAWGDDIDPRVELASDGADSADSIAAARVNKLRSEGHSSDRYLLKGEVGRGGMGAVLQIFDTDLRRDLAMKVILGPGGESTTGTPGVSAQKLVRFLEEAQVTGQLDHPGIVPVHELGVDAVGRVYFTMRLVKGQELSKVIDKVHAGDPDWTLTRALGVLLKVCEAMSYAHDKGVIHRDLKPANVMVGKHGEVYVMDWGLARVKGREDSHDVRLRKSIEASLSVVVETDRRDASAKVLDAPIVTMDGAVVGTPFFMPPEQAAGRLADIGPRSDVYALGGMLYHLLTGNMPYHTPGDRVSPYMILARVLHGAPEPVHELAPDIPAELQAICEKAMEREPAARYANMGELADDLRAFLEDRVVQAYRTGAVVEFKKWMQRNKALAATAAAAVLISVGGVGSVAYVQAKGKASEKELRKIAETSELLAKDNELIATERADDVLRLSLSQDYEDLLAQADTLWPPHPNKVDALRTWLTTAEKLIASLPDLIEQRDGLRAQALPRTDEEIRADRASYAEFEALTRLQAELQTKQKALAVRRGRAQVELPEVNWSAYPQDAGDLHRVAASLVDPERVTFGQEALGLALATRAAERASAAERALILTSVAWGRFALGDDEGALEAGFTAFDLASDARREEAGNTLAQLEEAVESASRSAGQTAVEAEIAALESALIPLETRVSERRTWSFSDDQNEETKARWWHKQLTGLIPELESLSASGSGLLTAEGVSAEHGWSVRKRLALAERLEAGFAPEGEFAQRWEESLPAIRAAYPGLDLTLQMGLVPIGADSKSKLWEFWHVQSGVEPLRNEIGELVIEGDSGLVFVLVPGGSFWMGAQSANPNGRNYDRNANSNENPVHEVVLSGFLLSKYEMTQGQWERLAGSNPSRYGPGNVLLGHEHDLTHPVEQVSWFDCVALLPRAGLVLPSEAQWEYGARGGTDTVWWTGSERDSLKDLHAANLADQAATRYGVSWPTVSDWLELDDGFVVHAPVDGYAANGFGLHNVHGNVWEWCLDGYDGGFYGRSAVLDPVNPAAASAHRVLRGGGFEDTAADARASNRDYYTPAGAHGMLGLRPTRVITR